MMLIGVLIREECEIHTSLTCKIHIISTESRTKTEKTVSSFACVYGNILLVDLGVLLF